jgi:regulator of sigma E protease
VETIQELAPIIARSPNEPVTLSVKRGEEDLQLEAVPQAIRTTDETGAEKVVGTLGIVSNPTGESGRVVHYNPLQAAWKGASETWFVIDRTFRYLGRLVSGREEADQLGGPLRIAQVSGQVATLGIIPLINLTAILSVSIGLINLFPIPMLDGGHLLYYGYEAAAGKPLTERAQEYGFRIGLALVLCLMVFATWNDLVHLPLLNGLFGLLY